MGDIIQFPLKKEKFIDMYASNLPDSLKECLSCAYDEILEKTKNIPSIEIRVSNEQLEKISEFKNKYNSTILELLSELLKAKAETRTLKAGL